MMIRVVLAFPNDTRKEVLLAGIPSKGDQIMLANGVDSTKLIVQLVLWMEGPTAEHEPSVVLFVRPRDA